MSGIKRTEIYHRDCESTGVAKAAENLFISQPASVNSLQEQKKCMAYSFLNVYRKENDPNLCRKAVFGIRKTDRKNWTRTLETRLQISKC